MALLFKSLLYLHMVAGSLSLILFWIPVFTRKGGKTHRQVGVVYVWCMSVVVGTAFLMSIYDLLFTSKYVLGLSLLFLSFLTLNPLWSGMDALKQKKQLSKRSRNLRLALEGILFVYGAFLLATGIYYQVILVIIFGSVGVILGFKNVRIFAQKTPEYNWFDTHMSGMIVSGAAAYTAFFAFGARSVFGFLQGTYWVILPWVLPTLIAVVSINILRKKYKVKTKQMEKVVNC